MRARGPKSGGDKFQKNRRTHLVRSHGLGAFIIFSDAEIISNRSHMFPRLCQRRASFSSPYFHQIYTFQKLTKSHYFGIQLYLRHLADKVEPVFVERSLYFVAQADFNHFSLLRRKWNRKYVFASQQRGKAINSSSMHSFKLAFHALDYIGKQY